MHLTVVDSFDNSSPEKQLYSLMADQNQSHRADAADSGPEKIKLEISQYHDSLLAVAYRILFDREKAKDVVQDAYLKVLESDGAFRGAASMKTYLYRIVVNQCIDIKRRNIRWLSVQEKFSRTLDHTAESHDDRIDNDALVRKLFAAIPDTFKMPMILAEVKELSYEEIADTLKISLNTVRTRIFRCREKLRKEFNKSGISL